MVIDNWVLTITFDSLAEQFVREPELAFPNDEASQVVAKLQEWSGGLPEEMPEWLDFSATGIKATFPTLQGIDEVLAFITFNTIPRTLILTREVIQS